ncbi:hypothetical protein AVEN_4522-1 [Araneus ventricosus]|uniref:Uncharacterized protein n=1 Tax=Araneus ventricosus TaxID=182803 RepID=A0A4Y2BKN0_ARAVE|nr:hypothetical protein AVEN_4522-1 [Araneus ventricosus]
MILNLTGLILLKILSEGSQVIKNSNNSPQPFNPLLRIKSQAVFPSLPKPPALFPRLYKLPHSKNTISKRRLGCLPRENILSRGNKAESPSETEGLLMASKCCTWEKQIW